MAAAIFVQPNLDSPETLCYISHRGIRMLAPNTSLLGRYLVIRLIHKGNMGAVYLAEDTRLGNEVALKETFFTSGDAMMREQFHREARLLSRLRHPSLPRVTDYFIDDNGEF